MSQIPSVLAFVASIVGTGTALAPAVFDGRPAQSAASPQTPGAGLIHTDGRGTVTVRRDADGLFYMPGRVNGVAVRFLLDSGANMVIVPSQLAAAAGVPAGGRNARVRTVAGGTELTLSHARRIEAAGWTIGNLPVAVAADSSAPPILGMNALTRMGRITMMRDRMVFEAAPGRGQGASPAQP